MDGQKNRNRKSEIIKEWVLFFLSTLQSTIKKLEDNYLVIKDKRSYLNDRQQDVLDFIITPEPVKILDAINNLKDHSSYIMK